MKELLAKIDNARPQLGADWLIDGATPANESELIRAVRAIESYPGIG